MKNKKGFTLVELLAVIVILAIILAIAVPGISGIINSTKQSAFEENAKMIVKGIDYKYLESTVTGTGAPVAATNITDASLYGGTQSDYTTICIKTLNPTSICVTTAAASKFGTYTATVTKSSVTYAACTCY